MPFNRLNHSILGEIRPRFVLQIQCDRDKAFQAVLDKSTSDTSVLAIPSRDVIFLRIPEVDQHYWSPEMTVRFDKSEFSDEVFACCLLGPKQSVWAMFALIYGFVLLATAFGGSFGLVQYQTTGSSPFLWVIPIGLIVFFSFFLSAKMGQRKGRDQMLHLVSFLYHSLDEITELQRIERR